MKRVLTYEGFKLEIIDDGMEFYDDEDGYANGIAGYISSDILNYPRKQVFDDESMEEYAIMKLINYVDEIRDNLVINYEDGDYDD